MRYVLCSGAVLFCAMSVVFAGASFDFDGRTLLISTDRYVATWRDGGCIGLTTRLPKEAVIADPAGAMSTDVLPSGVCSLHG